MCCGKICRFLWCFGLAVILLLSLGIVGYVRRIEARLDAINYTEEAINIWHHGRLKNHTDWQF